MDLTDADSLLFNITQLYDLHTNLISYLPIESILALSVVSKQLRSIFNEPHVWKQMLKQDFNWPQKRRGKGRKKQKNITDLTVVELRGIYIQKFNGHSDIDDKIMVDLLRPIFEFMFKKTPSRYIPGFGFRNYTCRHTYLSLIPKNVRRPLYLGCQTCSQRLALSKGLTKTQIDKLIQSNVLDKLSMMLVLLAMCGEDPTLDTLSNSTVLYWANTCLEACQICGGRFSPNKNKEVWIYTTRDNILPNSASVRRIHETANRTVERLREFRLPDPDPKLCGCTFGLTEQPFDTNEVYIWKLLLRRDFNWPPKRRGKGSKKQQKNKTEMTAAGLKLIYIQKYKEMQPKDDSDLIELIRPLYVKMYVNVFEYNLYQNYCDHRPLRFVPEQARKPLYLGCEKCRSRIELNAGLTKGQMRELFEVKHYSQYQFLHALCGSDIQIYHVADLEQIRP